MQQFCAHSSGVAIGRDSSVREALYIQDSRQMAAPIFKQNDVECGLGSEREHGGEKTTLSSCILV